MKKLLLLLIPLSIIVSCGGGDETNNSKKVKSKDQPIEKKSEKGNWLDSDKKLLDESIADLISDIKSLRSKNKEKFISRYCKKIEDNFSSFEEAKNNKNKADSYKWDILSDMRISIKGHWCQRDVKILRKELKKQNFNKKYGDKKANACMDCVMDRCINQFDSFKSAEKASSKRLANIGKKCAKAAGINL